MHYLADVLEHIAGQLEDSLLQILLVRNHLPERCQPLVTSIKATSALKRTRRPARISPPPSFRNGIVNTLTHTHTHTHTHTQLGAVSLAIRSASKRTRLARFFPPTQRWHVKHTRSVMRFTFKRKRPDHIFSCFHFATRVTHALTSRCYEICQPAAY